MKPTLIILGAVGTCLDLAEAALLEGKFSLEGFLDDGVPQGVSTPLGPPVLGALKDAIRFSEAKFINGIGSPQNFRRKAAILKRFNMPDSRFATVVHPKAALSAIGKIGFGSWILSNSSVGVEVSLGDHVAILQNCVIGHESVLGSNVTLASGVIVSGRVNIGEGTYIGAGTVIREDVSIGSDCLIGAGSVVVSDLPSHTLSMGVPAKVVRNWLDQQKR
jgi:sugar O-acyltransferase (sialic acid O-acetyltransferase NeuD family)